MSYNPAQLSGNPSLEDLRKYLERELRRISEVIEAPDTISIRVRHEAPAKLYAGLIAFADGTDWNPGSGRGLYEYRVASWVKL